MTKAIFTYLGANLLLIPLLSLNANLDASFQLLICLPLILFIGIPHGAIDNILFRKEHTVSNAWFIATYLTIILVNVILWIIFPAFTYLIFLIISAYHFGQSQFSHYFKKDNFIHKLLYLFWGISILSALIYFNQNEILLISSQNDSFGQLASINSSFIVEWIFIGSTILSTIGLGILYLNKKLPLESLGIEILALILIFASFYLFPLIIGFTLYFIILHSYKVLEEEFIYLKIKKSIRNFTGFIRLITPFSIVSIFGMLFLIALAQYNLIPVSTGYLLLILISSITLPHVFVMENFYEHFTLKK